MEETCGKLNKAKHGTEMQQQIWEMEYTKFLEEAGLIRGKTTLGIFYHPGRNAHVTVHGDDFMALHHEGDRDWFRQEIATSYELNIKGRTGPENKDSKRVRICNRIIEWTHKGNCYEADHRHAEIIERDLGVQDSSSVVTAGEKKDQDDT